MRSFPARPCLTSHLAHTPPAQIDDMDAISDIAASWSLSETSASSSSRREPKRIAAAAAAGYADANDGERELHVRKWREVPSNLWPTERQLGIQRELAGRAGEGELDACVVRRADLRGLEVASRCSSFRCEWDRSG